MTFDLSHGEVTRRIEELERRVASKVSRELYDRDLVEIKSDLHEIKENQKEERLGRRALQQMVIAQFIALIVGLVLLLVGRI